jgi:hypothetical protein
MGIRHPNHRLVKIHRSYTVEEIASLFGNHRNSVREWIRKGLATIDQRRPLLVHGADLVAFLKQRRAANKCPCRPGQIYCVRCRTPQEPVDCQAIYQPLTARGGNLVGVCSSCGNRVYRRVSLAKLDAVKGELRVSMPEALRHIDESSQPSVNSDFRQEAADHD